MTARKEEFYSHNCTTGDEAIVHGPTLQRKEQDESLQNDRLQDDSLEDRDTICKIDIIVCKIEHRYNLQRERNVAL